jgi:uncharacterized protein DUF4394
MRFGSVATLFFLSLFAAACYDTTTNVVAPSGPPSGSIVFVTSTNQLLWVDKTNPTQVLGGVALSGTGGPSITTLDYRPATGDLYGFSTSNGTLYRIDTNTGIVQPVGNVLTGFTGPQIDLDFSPSADRARLVSTDEENARINPADGQSTFDTDLSAGDIAGIAYDNNHSGATTTNLYGIDITHDQLVRIGGVDGNPSPNGGVVTPLGPLGIDAGPASAFDIAADGTAYAAFNVNALTSLYTIDLTRGTATSIGVLGAGGGVTSMAVVP